MPSLADLTRSWLLKQLGLSSSLLTEADLQAALFTQGTAAGVGLASNRAFRSGYYYDPSLCSTQIAVALTLNAMRLSPFEVGARATFDRIACEITTAGTTGNVVRMGIYSTGADGMPNALVLDAGVVDSTVIGNKEIIINQILQPGLYWLGAVSQVGVACSIRCLSSHTSQYIATNFIPTSNTYLAYLQANIVAGLPPSWTPGDQTYEAPRIWLRAV